MNEWNDQIVLDKKWQWRVTPHVENVKIALIHGVSRYTVQFQTDVRFLLRRMMIDTLVEAVRLRLHDEPLYAAPGWLHYQTDRVDIKPALYMGESSPWNITIETNGKGWNVPYVQIALIGERADQIK